MDIQKIVSGVVLGIVGIVIVFLLVNALAPELTNAGNNLSASGLPLASLFSGSGIVITIIVVGILLGIIAIAFNIMQHKK